MIKELKQNADFISRNILEIHKNHSTYLIRQIYFKSVLSKFRTDLNKMSDIILEDYKFEKQSYIFFSRIFMQYVLLECWTEFRSILAHFTERRKRIFEWRNKYALIWKNIIVINIEHNLSMKIVSTILFKTMQ